MDPRRRARLILILGVLLALIAGASTFFYASSSQSAVAPAVPTTDVVVATREIPARTALAAADLKVAKVNADVAPPAALKDPKDAIGKVLIQAVSINEPILPAKFAAAERNFTVFPPGEQVQPGSPNYRVMTITVPDAFAVGGVLVAGDTVDIMYVFQFDPSTKLQLPPGATTTAPVQIGGTTVPGTTSGTKFNQDSVAKIILGPMQILARTATVYTIRVDAALAERLAYVQAAGGTLQLLLRAPTDDRAVSTSGATFSSVYSTFKLPIPERVVP